MAASFINSIGSRAIWISALMVLCSSLTACDEKKASQMTGSPKPSSSGECDEEDDDCDSGSGSGSGSGTTFSLCAALKANTEVKAQFSSYSKWLCDEGGLEELRDDYYAGTGSHTVKTLRDGVVPGESGSSEMRLVSASLIPTTPAAYFAMVKLQMTDPDEFKAKKFETDAAVNYTPRKVNSDDVTYYYERSGEDIVGYVATTKFHTLRKGEAYIHTTLMDESATTDAKLAEKLKGLVIINRKDSNSTEVLTISDQQYDNNNNHNSTKTNIINGLAKDQERSYRNGRDAEKALE